MTGATGTAGHSAEGSPVTAEAERTPITAEAVRELLLDPKLFPDLPRELADDDELALDSLGLVWFLHQLELRYGLSVEPTEEYLTSFTSVRRITEHLAGVREP